MPNIRNKWKAIKSFCYTYMLPKSCWKVCLICPDLFIFSEKAFRNCQLTIVAVLPSAPSNEECLGPDTTSFSLDKVYLINP